MSNLKERMQGENYEAQVLQPAVGGPVPEHTREAGPLTAAAEVHTGAMLALIPSDADIARIVVDGGEPADQLHTTICYLGDAVNFSEELREAMVDAYADIAPYIAPFTADGFAIAAFNPTGIREDADACIVELVSGDQLAVVRDVLYEILEDLQLPVILPKQHAPWIPHITLIYGDEIAVENFTEGLGPVLYDKLRLAFGGENYDIMLGSGGYASSPETDSYMSAALSFMQEHFDTDNELHKYWTKDPEGLAKWAGKPHPWTALYKHLRKHIKNDRMAKATAAKWFHDVKGYWPGDQAGTNKTGPG